MGDKMTSRREFMGLFGAALGASAMPAFAAYEVPQKYMPVLLPVSAALPANEIHVDPNRFYLFWTLGNGQAIRYVVGVGRPGLYESGTFTVGAKQEWPKWTPTPDMIKREPEKYEQYADGVPGGPNNPLGSRALYLYKANGRDSLLRIHGTPSPWTIGQAVSNGCARLVNSHVEHLYAQVPKGSKVTLYPQA